MEIGDGVDHIRTLVEILAETGVRVAINTSSEAEDIGSVERGTQGGELILWEGVRHIGWKTGGGGELHWRYWRGWSCQGGL